jgi:hypothetical protein
MTDPVVPAYGEIVQIRNDLDTTRTEQPQNFKQKKEKSSAISNFMFDFHFKHVFPFLSDMYVVWNFKQLIYFLYIIYCTI